MGTALLAVYAAGLAVPFLAVAGDEWAWDGCVTGGRHWLGTGGAPLVVMGLAMVAGYWIQLFAPLVGWFARTGWPPI